MTTCILIPTSTLYYNIWEPHIKLMDIYWKDCPFPIYLGTNKDTTLNYDLNEKFNVNYIFSTMEPKKDNILSRMLYYLEILKKKYKNVLLLIDDFFLTRNVNNEDINECIKLLNKDTNIGMIRLHPSPEGNNKNIKTIIDLKYKGQFPNIKINESYTDYICSHCLNLLYLQTPNFMPHIDADLEDSRIKTKHVKKDNIQLINTNGIWLQPSLWNIDVLIQGLKNMITDNINDFRKFETKGSKYYKNKLLLAPRYRWDIIYPCRGFCGGGVFSGVISKWALQLFKKHNIHIPLYDNNFIFDTTKIKSNHDKIGKNCNIEYAEKI
jgi:hypothetical protein